MSVIELQLFGGPSLRRTDTGEEVDGLRPQVREVLAAIALEGDRKFAIADERLIGCLWGTVTGWQTPPARLDRLVYDTREIFRAFDNGSEHVQHRAGKVRLLDVTVDAREFDRAYDVKDYATALVLADRGPLLDGLHSRSNDSAYDWAERARGRYGTRVDRCYRDMAEKLAVRVSNQDADIVELIDVVDRRATSAVSYDLADEAEHAADELEKLHAIQNSGTLTSLPGARAIAADHLPYKLPLERLLVKRLGSGLSLQVDPEHIDHAHRYTNVERVDLLDYASGDFYSIRRLRGINAGSQPSAGLVCSESSEARITFDDTETRAYETVTRKRLAVESLRPSNVSLYQHGFRILFPRPLAPDEAFDISYAIRLPGELAVLSPVEEMMSIALVRWPRGVARLDFRVCLNFEPLAVSGEYVDDNGEFVPVGEPLTLSEYAPEEWYERDLNIAWSAQPYVVSYGVDEPKAAMYIIKYRV